MANGVGEWLMVLVNGNKQIKMAVRGLTFLTSLHNHHQHVLISGSDFKCTSLLWWYIWEKKDKTELFRETILFLKGHKLHSALFNFLILTMKPRLFLNPLGSSYLFVSISWVTGITGIFHCATSTFTLEIKNMKISMLQGIDSVV